MGFSCGCYDSDWGVVDEYTAQWAGHKTVRCDECRCELAPGHVVHTTILAEWWDEPFEDMDDGQLAEVLADEETEYHYTCERCSDLADAVSGAGMCWYTGEFWAAYRDWLESRGLGDRTRSGRPGGAA